MSLPPSGIPKGFPIDHKPVSESARRLRVAKLIETTKETIERVEDSIQREKSHVGKNQANIPIA